MKEDQFLWFVGIFEGEGTISLKDGRRPNLRIQMTDKDIICRVREIVGVGTVTGPYLRKHYKPVWSWCLQSAPKSEELLLKMIPWLGNRRKDRAKEVIRIYNLHKENSQLKKSRLCSTLGCDRKFKAKNMCNAHYEAKRKYEIEDVPCRETDAFLKV